MGHAPSTFVQSHAAKSGRPETCSSPPRGKRSLPGATLSVRDGRGTTRLRNRNMDPGEVLQSRRRRYRSGGFDAQIPPTRTTPHPRRIFRRWRRCRAGSRSASRRRPTCHRRQPAGSPAVDQRQAPESLNGFPQSSGSLVRACRHTSDSLRGIIGQGG